MNPKQVKAIVAFSLLVSLVPNGQAQHFGASFDNSKWQAATSKVDCSLTHTIPGYGKGVFNQVCGEKQTFALEEVVVSTAESKTTKEQIAKFFKECYTGPELSEGNSGQTLSRNP